MYTLAFEQSAILSQFILHPSVQEPAFVLEDATTTTRTAAKSVLIIGSSPSLVRLLAVGLAAESLKVDVADSIDDATQKFETRSYSLVIVDLDPPSGGTTRGYDPAEILQQLKAQQPSVQVLALGGQRGVSGLIRAMDHGADDFVFKPFSLIELMTRVRALHKAKPETVEVKRRSSKLVLHRERCQVERDGRLIDLTPREFGLLEVLVENAGKTLSRATLTQQVWNMSAEANTNIVDVYIKYLRDKIDGEHDDKLIRTVRGMGYIFQN
jgi:two-component system copper resistance phosphate regulon response regulator CusR